MGRHLLFLFSICLIYAGFSQENRMKEKFRQAEEYRIKNPQNRISLPPGLQNADYAVDSTIYTPYPYTGTIVLNGIDDHWTDVIPIGFDFCYFGSRYDQLIIGSNGQITFDLSQANGYNSWQITAPLPNTTDMPANTICAAFRDTDPSVAGQIYYNTFGIAPNRALVISWDSVALFSASCQSGNSLSSFQIALHEGSSVIDVYIENSTSCSAWNNGYGEIGLLDPTGTVAIVPPGRNYPATWTALNEAWQFVPTAGICFAPCGVMNDSICFVNTNSNSKNEIFFNHVSGSGGSAGTIIYRLNAMSAWDSIGFVPYNQPDVYTDLTANPNQQQYTYCIERVDSCGNIGAKSPTHSTIFLQSNLGSGSQINLSWTAYAGIPVSTYYIYRGANSSTMSLLATVPGSTLSYTDISPLTGTNFYRVETDGPAGCTSNAPHDTLFGSNYMSNATSVSGNHAQPLALSIYPNPSTGNATISSGWVMDEIRVTDVLGNTIYESKQRSGDVKLTLKDAGLYFVTVTTGKTSVTRKLVVN